MDIREVENFMMQPVDDLVYGGRRAAAVGWSIRTDGAEAGAEAATAAFADLRAEGAEPQLVVVFCSTVFDLAEVARGVMPVVGEVPVIGSTTSGEIAGAGPCDGSVVVMALGGDGLVAATAAAEVVDGDVRRAAAEASRCVDAVVRRDHTVLLLLSDGLAGDQQDVARGAYERVGAGVPLAGGCAGGEDGVDRTQQLSGGRVMSGAVCAAVITSDAPIGIGVRHGWTRVGEPMTVTESSGVVVRTLDDEAALDVYLDRINAPGEVRTEPDAFAAQAVTRPLGLSRRSGEDLRLVTAADFDDRALVCVAEVPQGAQCSVMEGDVDSVLEAATLACGDALAGLDGPPSAVLVFDSVARRGLLGQGVVAEIGRIARACGGAPLAGFYTLGEIARSSGANGFHNQAVVVVALG